MNSQSILYQAADACQQLVSNALPVSIGIILGSGLGASADRFLNAGATAIPYSSIPGMPTPHVTGHAGRLVIGQIDGINVAMLQGRVHYYEGHPLSKVAFGTQLLAAMGMQTLIVTNAAGGIRSSFRPGDLMLIKDHIRPLAAADLTLHEAVQPSASDKQTMNSIASDRHSSLAKGLLWHPELLDMARGTSTALRLHEGVYAMMTGPTYETPAEIRMMQHLGADAVGMSTVPEATAAAALGVRVLGISCITNVAAGLSDQILDHHDVTATASAVEVDFVNWLWALIPSLRTPAPQK